MNFMLLVYLCLLPFIIADETVIGNVRVQTLSPTLLRVENIGPKGYENRTTLMVTSRDFPGVPIQSVKPSGNGMLVTTQYYSILVTQDSSPPSGACYGQKGVDVMDPKRSPNFPDGTNVKDMAACCAACEADPGCNGWIWDSVDSGVNCWPLNAWGSTAATANRVLGCSGNNCFTVITGITVMDPQGKVLVTQQGTDNFVNLLHWPSPLSAKAYVITDFPRFYVPAWGPTPKEGLTEFAETNGYDYTNNQNGDFYIFLLGDSLDSWFSSRADFVKLVGPTPVIPDWAFGTWFTYWHSYTESEAKDDIAHWKSGNLPLNVYGLDMNWRNTANEQDHYYSHPNTDLFPNFTEWFAFLHANNLKTYFNDHPYPVDMQTSPSEVGFRYGGLSEWMDRGLDYWWFDHNWGFSIPPPNALPINGWGNSNTDGTWYGLDNAAWGSHVYFESVSQYYQAKGSQVRPMTLSKFGLPDWRPDTPSTNCMEHPSQHRYPVWWTGDGVNLQASVQSMVDNGVHDFKPYVHSDCGGDYRGTAGDLLRWTAHCVFGTILRFHGEDHRPWTYDAHTEEVILSYLNIRYKLIPSFISAGQAALTAAYPLVVRGDLIWPDQTDASSNNQYIHLNDTLIAPIFDSTANMTSRSVWIPPGSWQDAWSGAVQSGPQTITVSQPYEQIPMWHRRGTFTITVDSPARRIEDQDWGVLTLETYPDFSSNQIVEKSLFSKETAARTDLTMETLTDDTNGVGLISFHISESEDKESRGWNIRLHLLPGQECVSAIEDGNLLKVKHISPVSPSESFFPFGGVGSAPAHQAGNIAEIYVPKHYAERTLKFVIQ